MIRSALKHCYGKTNIQVLRAYIQIYILIICTQIVEQIFIEKSFYMYCAFFSFKCALLKIKKKFHFNIFLDGRIVEVDL